MIGIDLWLWPLDLAKADLAALARHLSPGEQARADRFLRPGDGHRHVAARGRMREILAGYLGAEPAALRFLTGPQGKPALPGGPAFNLSHAGGMAALAVAPDAPDLALGVDIEAPRTVEPGLAAQIFSASDCAALERLDIDAQRRALFRCWTRKEAVIKAHGSGLSTPLRSFDVSLGEGAPALLRCAPDLGRPAEWQLVTIDPGPDLLGTVAARTGGAALSVTRR